VVGVAFTRYSSSDMSIRKGPEFERRAAPTTELLGFLKSQQPATILLERCPYANYGIAKDVSRVAPGWTRDLIHVNESPESCRDCMTLRWDAGSKKYTGQWREGAAID